MLVPGQFIINGGRQVKGFAGIAEGKRGEAARVLAGGAKVLVFVKDDAAAGGQRGSVGDAVFSKIEGAVAQEPPADVYGLGRPVVQLDPVRSVRT